MTTNNSQTQIDYIEVMKLKVIYFLKHRKTTLIHQNFTFTGQQSSFIDEFNGNIHIFGNAKSIQINLIGKQIHSNSCCLQCLYGFLQCLVVSSCCQCWKDYGHPAYVLKLKSFQIISQIIYNSPKLESMSLTIIDNNLNKQKMKILSQAIKKSSIVQFQLQNLALDSNYEGNQFNEFLQNCNSIQQLKLNVLSLIWCHHIVQNVKNPNLTVKSQNIQVCEQTPGRIIIPTLNNYSQTKFSQIT